MKYILYATILVVLFSCNPGRYVDKGKSNSYFKSRLGLLYYSPGGNWFGEGINRCRADKKTFEVVSRDIARDQNSIYYCGYRQNVDYETFYIDSQGIARDSDFVYKYDLWLLKPIAGIDAGSFEYLDVDTFYHTWSRDKNYYYMNHKKIDVDYNTFTFLNTHFSTDKDSLYAELRGWKFISVKEFSSDLSVINSEYIHDSNTLYYVSTFKRVELRTNHFSSFDTIRIVDNDVICVNDKVIYYGIVFKSTEVDAYTFELYDPNVISFYSKDKNHVYYREEIVAEANPATYVPLAFGFGKDDKHVYHETHILEGVDAKSFRERGKYSCIYRDDYGNKYDWLGNKL